MPSVYRLSHSHLHLLARARSLSVCVLCALSGGGGVLMMDKLGRFESAVADLTSTVQRLEMEKTNQAEEVEG